MITWGATSWALPALLIGVVLIALVVWSYGAPLRSRAHLVAASFKAAGLVLLLLCLVEPMVRSVHARPGANQLVVLVDDSASLAVHDAGADEPRSAILIPLLSDEAPWLARVGQDFEVRRHVFDRRTRAISGPAELTFTGEASHLGAALEQLGRRASTRPTAGIVLFTDGISTDTLEVIDDWEGLPPIHPVLIGGAPERDLALGPIEVTQTNFEQAPVTLAVDLSSRGFDGERVELELFDRSGVRLERQVVHADDEATVEVRFDAPPDATGLHFYRLRAGATGRDAGEATLANNERWAIVDRGAGPYRVLYVSGRPNWEFKFLSRATSEDPELELVGLIRIARRQPKFTFRAGADRRNQLWDGFDNRDADVAEELDEPVLLRLGTSDEFELRAGFPATAEDLFAYHAIIIDDLEASFFTPDQQSLVEEFVSRRGGGFLALGGVESFAGGGYARTPIEGLLPVYLEGVASDAPNPTGPWSLSLTRDGWLEPWVRLRATEEAERQRLADMPTFHTLNRVGTPKPAAQVLAHVLDRGNRARPALVVQRFGKGRSAALTIGDLWRWDLQRPDPTVSDLGAAWRQTLRWLVADVPKRVQLTLVPGAAGDPRRLRATVRDEVFDAMHDATLELTVTPPTGASFPLVLLPSATVAGSWEAKLSAREAGPWRARLEAAAADGSELGVSETGWVEEPGAEEFARLAADRAAMAQLARRTGGKLLAPEDLDDFAAGLSEAEVPITDERLDPLWHRWWVFLLALCCFCAEWGVRRFHGLP